MKIGEFARKYDVNASTVRYYIEKSLITPKKENGQYVFDKICMEQMERILQYKKYRFSLEDIDLLSYYEGASGFRDKGVIGRMIEIFRRKEKHIQKEIDELKEIQKNLKNEVAEYEAEAEAAEKEVQRFLPIEVLDIMFCPVCQRRLKLKSADIEGRGISKGTLGCSCGYHAAIANGMILCEGRSAESPLKIFDNVNSVEEVTEDFSPILRTLIEKAQLWVYQKVTTKGKKFKYALAGPLFHNFLPKYIKALPEDTLYIVTDVSTDKLEKTQRYLDGADRKLLYIAGEIENIPIKKDSIELYIDDFSSNNYSLVYNRSLFQSIGPLMKSKSPVIGQFINYSMAPASLENFKNRQTGFDPEEMKLKKVVGAMNDAGVKIREEVNCGNVTGNGPHFPGNVSGERVSVIAYSAAKE